METIQKLRQVPQDRDLQNGFIESKKYCCIFILMQYYTSKNYLAYGISH